MLGGRRSHLTPILNVDINQSMPFTSCKFDVVFFFPTDKVNKIETLSHFWAEFSLKANVRDRITEGFELNEYYFMFSFTLLSLAVYVCVCVCSDVCIKAHTNAKSHLFLVVMLKCVPRQYSVPSGPVLRMSPSTNISTFSQTGNHGWLRSSKP